MNQEYKATQAMVDDGSIIVNSTHRFVTDASTMRFPVGSFPNQIKTNLGNGQPFVFDAFIGGNDAPARYLQQFGCITLLVFNS